MSRPSSTSPTNPISPRNGLVRVHRAPTPTSSSLQSSSSSQQHARSPSTGAVIFPPRSTPPIATSHHRVVSYTTSPTATSYTHNRSVSVSEHKPTVNMGEALQLLNALRAHPENGTCADCAATQPDWAASNIGILICVHCSGVHRSLGTHISFVRSVTMDKWDIPVIKSMRTNDSVNRELEYHVPTEYLKPNVDAAAKDRVRYITAKYKDRAFVCSNSHPNPKAAVYAALSNKSVAERKASSEPGMIVTAGILFIVLISGKNLKKMDLLSESDPYCVFSNGRQKLKSKTIDDSCNPDWHRERLSLSMENLSTPITLEVYDVDPTSDELMGKASIDVSTLVPGVETEMNVSLDTKGSIQLTLKFEAM